MSEKLAGSTAPAVDRALRIIKAISAAGQPVTLGALSHDLALPKSSALAICRSLQKGGMIQKAPTGGYKLGVAVVDLAYSYLSMSTITDQFVAEWEQCGGFLDETIVLSVLDGADVVYVACKNGKVGVSFNYRIGMRLPAWSTASGKALLSTIGVSALNSILPPDPLPVLTPKGVASRAALALELERSAGGGYFIDDEEVRPGMCCIGAPVFDAPRGPAVAAVAMSMLKGEFEAKRAEAVDRILTFSNSFTKRLGGEMSNAALRGVTNPPKRPAT